MHVEAWLMRSALVLGSLSALTVGLLLLNRWLERRNWRPPATHPLTSDEHPMEEAMRDKVKFNASDLYLVDRLLRREPQISMVGVARWTLRPTLTAAGDAVHGRSAPIRTTPVGINQVERQPERAVSPARPRLVAGILKQVCEGRDGAGCDGASDGARFDGASTP